MHNEECHIILFCIFDADFVLALDYRCIPKIGVRPQGDTTMTYVLMITYEPSFTSSFWYVGRHTYSRSWTNHDLIKNNTFVGGMTTMSRIPYEHVSITFWKIPNQSSPSYLRRIGHKPIGGVKIFYIRWMRATLVWPLPLSLSLF